MIHTIQVILQKKKLETAVLVCVFSIVTALLCIPVSLSKSSQVDIQKELGIDFEIGSETCQLSVLLNSTKQNQSEMNVTCSHYDGICSTYLTSLTDTDVLTTHHTNDVVTEEKVVELFKLVKSGSFTDFISEKCIDAVLPFVCQYVYPPCDGNGSVLSITNEQCLNVRDEVCAQEWRIVMNTEYRTLLPDCEMKNDSKPLKCHHHFKEYCGVCLPVCGKYSPASDVNNEVEKVFLIISNTVGLVGGFIVLAIAIIRRETMLAFPQVLSLLSTIGFMIIDMCSLINFIVGHQTLYCSHEDFISTNLQPSTYTQVSGFIFYFVVLFISLAWSLHIFHLFLGIAFPFWSKSFQAKKLKLCIGELFVITIVSIIQPILVLCISEYQIVWYPPSVVIPSQQILNYVVVITVTILYSIGTNMIIFCFWTLHKNYSLFKKGEHCWTIKFTVPEVKILLLLCYMIVFGVVVLLNYVLWSIASDEIIYSELRYFLCHLLGDDPKCELESVQQKESSPEIFLNFHLRKPLFLVVALHSWVQLLLAIQFQDVKRAAKWITGRCTDNAIAEKTYSPS